MYKAEQILDTMLSIDDNKYKENVLHSIINVMKMMRMSTRTRQRVNDLYEQQLLWIQSARDRDTVLSFLQKYMKSQTLRDIVDKAETVIDTLKTIHDSTYVTNVLFAIQKCLDTFELSSSTRRQIDSLYSAYIMDSDVVTTVP